MINFPHDDNNSFSKTFDDLLRVHNVDNMIKSDSGEIIRLSRII